MAITKKINISQDIVTKFSELVGYLNPIHVDKVYAKATKFKKCIAHGPLLTSFLGKLFAQEYSGPGSILVEQNNKFIKPCYVGDTVTMIIKLKVKEGNFYSLTTHVHNSKNILLIEGTALIYKK